MDEDMIRVCVAGATGWVGRPLCVAISNTSDLELVGAVSRNRSGQQLQEVMRDMRPPVLICASVADALSVPTNVMVDFTRPDVVKNNVLIAIRQGVHVVIGTSGLTEEDFGDLHQEALNHKVGVIAAGNFAMTAGLLQRFACEAAKYLTHWEILDYASATKIDAPSGTTRELAFRLSQVRKPEAPYPIEETIGIKGTRGAPLNDSQIHSIRLPSYTLAVEILFGKNDERLIIRHEAGSGPSPYMDGILLAIRKVSKYVGLVRGLERVLD
jgi:4-hydroxy-tetrahydrodipicolinate reductase